LALAICQVHAGKVREIQGK
ncbi:MAG: hypothetical protein WC655_15825, partial [Candidatus Hydrogenedentales bacterium]